MDRIITDNSKVNENLLNEVNALNKQNKELIVKNIDLQEQLLIQRVSQQRELLLAYHRYLTEELSLDLHELWVDEHLKANNCG